MNVTATAERLHETAKYSSWFQRTVISLRLWSLYSFYALLMMFAQITTQAYRMFDKNLCTHGLSCDMLICTRV